jgi:hypothetical protein
MKTLSKWSESVISLLRPSLKRGEQAPSHAAHYAQAMVAVGHQQLRLF